MAKLSKKQKTIAKKVVAGKKYSLSEAISLLKECAVAKFTESADISVNLGIDATKSEQTIRGSVVMPHGSGKNVRVAVFTSGDNALKAKEIGADAVGMEDLMRSMQEGDINYDTVIASPDAMAVVGRLGQLLGPRGLMPNPKVGTVTTDIATAVKNAKFGQAKYRTDKGGIIHASVGSVKLDNDKLVDNINGLLTELKKAKPDGTKGVYFKKISISSTMGISIGVDVSSTSIS